MKAFSSLALFVLFSCSLVYRSQSDWSDEDLGEPRRDILDDYSGEELEDYSDEAAGTDELKFLFYHRKGEVFRRKKPLQENPPEVLFKELFPLIEVYGVRAPDAVTTAGPVEKQQKNGTLEVSKGSLAEENVKPENTVKEEGEAKDTVKEESEKLNELLMKERTINKDLNEVLLKERSLNQELAELLAKERTLHKDLNELLLEQQTLNKKLEEEKTEVEVQHAMLDSTIAEERKLWMNYEKEKKAQINMLVNKEKQCSEKLRKCASVSCILKLWYWFAPEDKDDFPGQF